MIVNSVIVMMFGVSSFIEIVKKVWNLLVLLMCVVLSSFVGMDFDVNI